MGLVNCGSIVGDGCRHQFTLRDLVGITQKEVHSGGWDPEGVFHSSSLTHGYIPDWLSILDFRQQQ